MWMNSCCHVGRATRDAVERYTSEGKRYVTVRIAVPKSRTRTDFFTFECYGKVAEVALRFVEKGKVVSIEAALKQYPRVGDRSERLALAARKLVVLNVDLGQLADFHVEDVPDEGDALAA